MVEVLQVNDKPFKCMTDMLDTAEQVFGGEYSLVIKYEDNFVFGMPKNPSCLDIGANCGMFAVWAHCCLGASTVHCYEPNPEAYELLVENLKTYDVCGYPVNKGVVGLENAEFELVVGPNNSGETKIVPTRGSGNVQVVEAHKLPKADFVKVDTEGMELDILRYLDLTDTRVVMCETHSIEDRHAVEKLMQDKGFVLFSGFVRNPNVATLRFVKSEYNIVK